MESGILLITFLADLRMVIDEFSALRVSLFVMNQDIMAIIIFLHAIMSSSMLSLMNEDICNICKDSEVTKLTAIRQIVNEKDTKEGGRIEPWVTPQLYVLMSNL